MSQTCIVILIGLPAAGKTSFCGEASKYLKSNGVYECYTVTYDDIVGDNYHDKYKHLRNRALEVAENIVNAIICSPVMLQKHVVLIDDNMYYKSMRYQYYKLCRKYGLSFLQIYLDVALETAMTRNSIRGARLQVPQAVIFDMASKLEKPGNELWELNSLTLDANSAFQEITFTEFFKTLQKCLKKPVRCFNKNKTGTLPATKLQIIDLMLRKIIHEKVYKAKAEGKVLTAKKKEVLQKIKDQQILINKTWNESELYQYLTTLFN